MEPQALEIFNKIFSNDQSVKRFKKSNLRFIETEPHRFVEQNPDKPSSYGKLAKAGHQIMWVINYKTDKYIAKVIDGVFSLV
jgi:hypothetical protein